MKRLLEFDEFNSVNEVQYRKLSFAKKDVLWDMSLEEIVENAFEIAKPKMQHLASNARSKMTTHYLSPKHYLHEALEKLGIEVTKPTFQKIAKLFMKKFNTHPGTKGLRDHGSIRMLGESLNESLEPGKGYTIKALQKHPSIQAELIPNLNGVSFGKTIRDYEEVEADIKSSDWELWNRWGAPDLSHTDQKTWADEKRSELKSDYESLKKTIKSFKRKYKHISKVEKFLAYLNVGFVLGDCWITKITPKGIIKMNSSYAADSFNITEIEAAGMTVEQFCGVVISARM